MLIELLCFRDLVSSHLYCNASDKAFKMHFQAHGTLSIYVLVILYYSIWI